MNPSRSPLNIILSLIIIVAMGVLLYMNIRTAAPKASSSPPSFWY